MIRSSLNISGVTTISLQGEANSAVVEIHGLSVDEDRPHFVFCKESLIKIGEWLIVFAGGTVPTKRSQSGDKSDPRDWEIVVTGPKS